MVSWIVIIIGLVTSWFYTDLDSESILQGSIYPLLVAVFLTVFVIKIVLLFVPEKSESYTKGEDRPFIGKIDGGSGDGC